jgi:ubiquinone/menaquinone biosynthesis C-methylase UbiE
MKKHTRRVLLAVLVSTILVSGAFAADKKKTRPPRESWQQVERVMKDFNFQEGDAVADVGCGSGYFTFRISKVVGDKGTVYAMDISEKALRGLRGKLEEEKIENVKLSISDPKDTKLDECTVDAAIIINVLHHAQEDQWRPLINSVAKALKPGGFLYTMDFRKEDNNPFHPKDMLVSREQYIEFAEAAELVLDAEFHYLKMQHFIRFRKPNPDEVKE